MYGIKPRIVACVDSKGASISPTGLDLKRLLDVKKSKGSIEEYDSSSSRFDSHRIIENVDAEVLLEPHTH